ncbi:MAG: methyl-accepting chemotaxis protein [Clostridiales bacterium]
MAKASIIFNNELKVNKIAVIVNIIAYIVAFPSMYLLTYINIFKLDLEKLTVYAVISGIIIFLPLLFIKINMVPSLIKYLNIFATITVVFILAIDPNIEVNLTYLLPISISCLYLDKKLIYTTFIIGICNILGSRYIESISIKEPIELFLSSTLGYIIEYLALSAIFIILAKIINSLLSSLMDSEDNAENLEKLASLMEKSNSVSKTIALFVQELLNIVNEATSANEKISLKAIGTVNDSKENLEYIENTSNTLGKISEIVKNIANKTENINKLSLKTSEASKTSEVSLSQTIDSMNELENISNENVLLINQLSETTEQIDSITELISGISSQTNLLALNAAIESARAGEHGKGFSVVAEEIKSLSNESTRATKKIFNHIEMIKLNTQKVIDSTEEGSKKIKKSIEMANELSGIFKLLKDLQENINKQMKDVADSSSETNKYGDDINNIVKNIKDSTLNSINEIEYISNSTKDQSLLMKRIQSTFNELEKNANELNEISNN